MKRCICFILVLSVIVISLYPLITGGELINDDQQYTNNIRMSSEQYKNGILVFVENTNNVQVEINLRIFYYNNDNLVDTFDKNIRTLAPWKTVAIRFPLPYDVSYKDVNFTNYNFEYTAKKDSGQYIDCTKNVTGTYEKMSSGKILCTLTNNKRDIEYFEIYILFYKDDKIVDCDIINEVDFKAKSNITAKVSSLEEYDNIDAYILYSYAYK